MSEIITTSDYPINIEIFWITEKDIDFVKKDKNIDDENRIIIWLIIWNIRRKFFELNMKSIDFQHKEISNILDALRFPLKIDKEFKSFEELWNFIYEEYDFKHIKSHFLCNEIWISDFLKSSNIFLKYNFDNQPKETDKIINSVQEL